MKEVVLGRRSGVEWYKLRVIWPRKVGGSIMGGRVDMNLQRLRCGLEKMEREAKKKAEKLGVPYEKPFEEEEETGETKQEGT